MLIESFISYITDLEKFSKTVLEASLGITQSQIGFIGIIEPGTKALVFKYYTNTIKHLIRKKIVIYPDKNCNYGCTVIDKKMAVYITNKKLYPAHNCIKKCPLLGCPIPVEYFMSLPVILKDKVLGLIFLGNSKRGYTDNDLEHVKKIGKYFAIALERYWLEKEVKKYTQDLERMVEEKVKALKEREMLAIIGQMTLMVAHDLRNPLQAISNYSFLMKEAIKSSSSKIDKKIRKYARAIARNTEYMDKIVKNLQCLGKREAKLEFVNLQVIIGELLKNITKQRRIKIVTDVDNVQTQLDPILITRALSNLILNSIQAMPKGGTLTIRAKQKGSIIEFLVKDTGMGMDEEIKRNLFKPFYTTKAKGMGIGLALTKHVVELHNGTIDVKSQPSKGTKITIKIPAQTEQK
ncbi:MAG: GAF domain-containing sensor histidine kinase [Nitrososphaeria archaeon]